MSTVCIVHSKEDERFVRAQLLPPLPALGFERWLSFSDLSGHVPIDSAVIGGIEGSVAILPVLSSASLAGRGFAEMVSAVRTTGIPIVPIYLGRLPDTPVGRSLHSLAGVTWPPALEPGKEIEQWRALAELMPSDQQVAEQAAPSPGMPIEWQNGIFSDLLEDAIDRNDYSRAESLIASFARHLSALDAAYATNSAELDLGRLRRRRQFVLMRRYGAAVIRSGRAAPLVRRQYAQALIELGEFSSAMELLEGILTETEPDHPENVEARGLVGRTLKQQYVEAPTNVDAPRWLVAAIEAYGSVFRQDSRHFWHGINAATLTQRAARDGITVPDNVGAAALARQVLRAVQTASDREARSAFSLASEVEAYLVLGDYKAADHVLDAYLGHPDMSSFEVSSTYRQFAQVLQLEQSADGRPIVERLWRAVERHRANRTFSEPRPELTSASRVLGSLGRLFGTRRKEPLAQLLLRVTDPNWSPMNVPDLLVYARVGTVLSVGGSENTLKALLMDPRVVGVERSRPTHEVDCVRSLPFMKVTGTYKRLDGSSFDETGASALIAVVDDGIDVFHEAFLDSCGRSRIIGIWDQRDSSGTPPAGYGFGTFHDTHAIAGYIANPASLPLALAREASGHGTHVASIAGGRAAGSFPGGVAPDASLLVVISAAAETIGYSNSHLAALDFIGHIAAARDLPVVVNISQGMNAGAHDGCSALEVAFSEFSQGGRMPGRVIVKSAGNEGDRRGHAKVTLLPQAATVLRWRLRPDPLMRQPERMELWWTSANTYRFQLVAPSGQRSQWLDESMPKVGGRLRPGGPFLLEFVKRHVDNGDSLLTIEIGDGIRKGLEGDWELCIQSALLKKSQAPIHAWLERGGRFPSEFLTHESQEMTLSIPGTAHNVITVGAIDAAVPIALGPFSSFGPTRDGREKPDVVAPGVGVLAAKAGTADQAIAMDGTSMAAPHVAGAIALLLSSKKTAGQTLPTASQIGAALRQTTLNFSGQHDVGQGYGAVDVSALLASL